MIQPQIPSPSSQIQKPGPAPLSGDQQQRVLEALAKLRASIGAMIEWLPLERKRQADLAEHLGMDRISVQRLVALSRSHGSGIDALKRAPGVKAVEQFSAACAQSGSPQKLLGPLEQAIEGYRGVIRDLAGSKSALERRLRASLSLRSPQAPTEASAQAREQLYLSAAALLGRQTRVRMDITLFWPNAAESDMLDCDHTRGILGHRARPDAKPMTIELMGYARGEEAMGSTSDSTRGVLERYSTSPAPIVVSKGLGGRYRHVFDAAHTAAGRAVDLVVTHGGRGVCRHPIHDPDDPRLEVGALVREPTESLLLETYFHRDMLMGVIPEAELYAWSPAQGGSLADHWLDRLDPAPPLECLGAGLGRCATPLHEAHGDLMRDVFSRSGLNPDDFVGYRCSVRHPMWGGGYYITLDFSRG